jgi:hypothetical protein
VLVLDDPATGPFFRVTMDLIEMVLAKADPKARGLLRRRTRIQIKS